MNSLPVTIEKYLDKYSTNKWKLEINPRGVIHNVIVVPVICENENLRKLFISLLKNDTTYFSNTAILVVVNNLPESSAQVKNDNQKSLILLKTILSNNNTDDSLVTDIRNSKLSIGFIDASSKSIEMPSKIGGVGLARKIGMDEALTIFNYSSTAKNIIICLDADCEVDSNYLTTIVNEFNRRKLCAATVNFRHDTDEDSQTTPAIICYEIFLRYYVLGLKYADSPFAFHTIGSTIICDYESYIKVEGMNKKKAAEDFYFLEKLAKNYKIENISSAAVYPSSRSSWRVPFGTGQRIGRFLAHKQNEYLLYNPICFDILRQWLIIFYSIGTDSSSEYLKPARNIHHELYNFLIKQKFEQDWTRILANSTTPAQLTKQKHKWFDGFRTLKLIHYLRNNSFPQMEMFKAQNGLFERLGVNKDFFWHEKNVPSLDIQKKYLELLRELT